MPSRPVGLSRDLPVKRVMRAQVDDNDIVVWRAADGTISAWDNRCPHRGMALSHGFVRGNTLACLYHGWHYGTSGVCRYIPAHPDLEPPETIHAVRHSVIEAGGMIWVSTTEPAEAEAEDLGPLRSFIVDAPAEAVSRACATTAWKGELPVSAGSGRYTLGDTTLAVHRNPLAQATQVTVLATAGISPARRKALSRWCEAMRRTAEREGTA
jgi:nitrite reductase/ring-hydroxylating ferredoxin subunit